MFSQIHTPYVASISDLKKNPMRTVEQANGEAVAILNHNQPVFYCIPIKAYEALLDHLDDQSLVELIALRKNEKEMPVDIDDL
jgi:antitoxin StbD